VAQLEEPFEFAYDYNQLYLYDAGREHPLEGNEYLDALEAATESGLTVGARSGIVDVLMPRQENFAAVIEVKIITGQPPIRDDSDHVVDFDLPLPSGRLVLEGSGGSGTVEVNLPPGSYRARLTGEDFDAAAAWRYEDSGNPSDRYTLHLWRTGDERPPSELRRWPGYTNRL
jgi:hypothetical protein